MEYVSSASRGISAAIAEGMPKAFDETSYRFSCWINSHFDRPSLEDQVSMVWKYLDRFKAECLKTISGAYQDQLCCDSPQEVKRATLRLIYYWLGWPADVMEPSEQERLRAQLATRDQLTRWLLKAGFSDASIQQSFDLPGMRKEWESAIQQLLDQAEEVALVEMSAKTNELASPEHPSPEEHVDKKRSELRSPWRKAIRSALIHLGKDASYQAIATWMSEQIPGLELPEYCRQEGEEKGRADLGFLCRNNSSVRARFQKDITKVKKDL
jgi:hypothetical protein